MSKKGKPSPPPLPKPPSKGTDKNKSNEKTKDWYTSKNFNRGGAMDAMKQMIMKRTEKKDTQSKKKKKKKISLYA